MRSTVPDAPRSGAPPPRMGAIAMARLSPGGPTALNPFSTTRTSCQRIARARRQPSQGPLTAPRPRLRCDPAFHPPPRCGGAFVAKSHILVVDDEELYRRSLQRILTRAGHQVSEA